MYEGLKQILKLFNESCDINGCCSSCPIFDKCKKEDWELFRKDLEKLNIDAREIGL
ncbi:TPA: hypothetical protein PTV74_003163 [Clostridium botulinum]|nr:hypothetical protein [Clostridium botulinum]HDK7206318.1 hypothetical protein [Clostridium botulinum]HDK7210054.1 hypothetical protein [Clostridium botulinum]HDK7265503.1 hypothetical protein [Clostridium botulinum]HDK7269351.1 hypothetical protein [Clostridium botulinum]